MNALRQFQQDRRLLAALLMFCALLARVAVPPGYMIGGETRGGMPVIEICTGQGPMMLAVPGVQGADGHHDGDHGSKAPDHPCAFAAAAAAIDLTAALHPIMAHALTITLPVLTQGFARAGLGLAAPPPPKTGPPILR